MKTHLYCSAFSGMTGVLLGAFGAHALKDVLAERNTTQIWETAVLYQLVHGVALLIISLHSLNTGRETSAWFARAGTCWSLGIILFSGSLYWLALGAPRWIGPVTPLGGVALVLGWLCVGIAAFKSRPTDNT
jgi:uncharacterized membrane protein YgdD (TMEM256/DUF423 family)